MCGFVGFIGSRGSALAPDEILRAMTSRIMHRGPDGAGYWRDAEHGVALAHRRLAVLDLSPAGHQPMVSVCGRFVLVFNGEIYNHLDLRRELETSGLASAWRGQSDTETLLACFAHWGVKVSLQRSVGMFALALWDRNTHELMLARDRVGEKPLYYGQQGGVLLFGSELKALRAHPSFGGAIDRQALSLFLRYGYIPAPFSIYQGIRKLKPGCLLRIREDGQVADQEIYWDSRDVLEQPRRLLSPRDETVWIDELEGLLKDAVAQQMLADVPLGAFLSGGVDSSLIVALMQAQSKQPVKTFTIGFNERAYDETEYAKAVACHLGTEHTELYVSPQQAMNVIPSLPVLYDEPFADASQIPSYLVARLAREHVTVALSGDAGDELFCGYTRYLATHRLWGYLSRVPLPVRRAVAHAICGISPRTWNSLAGPLRPFLLGMLGDGSIGEKLHKGARALTARSLRSLYGQIIAQWDNPELLVCNADGLEPDVMGDGLQMDLASPVEQMMGYDLLTYLPDDILVKLDRAAMGVSLETRVPFLDHRVLEFAWQLPQSMKLRGNDTKWILRQVLYRHVPPALIERPKMGFGVPIGDWLRGPLREWAEELLSETRMRQAGHLRPEVIRRRWDEHLSGRRNWQYPLWCVLMFQQWLDNEMAG